MSKSKRKPEKPAPRKPSQDAMPKPAERRKDWTERQRRYSAGEGAKRLQEKARTMGEQRDKAHAEAITDRDKLKDTIREAGEKRWPPLIENAEIGLQENRRRVERVKDMNKGKPTLDRKLDRIRMGLIGWLCYGVRGAKNPPRVTGGVSWESKAQRIQRLKKHIPQIAEIFENNPDLYCDVREDEGKKLDWMPDLDKETLRHHIAKVRDSAIEFARALDID